MPNPTVELIALDVIGYHFMAPTIAIANAGTGRETVSWSPNTPGFVLQESTDLASVTWLNSASGTNNPVTITTFSQPNCTDQSQHNQPARRWLGTTSAE